MQFRHAENRLCYFCADPKAPSRVWELAEKADFGRGDEIRYFVFSDKSKLRFLIKQSMSTFESECVMIVFTSSDEQEIKAWVVQSDRMMSVRSIDLIGTYAGCNVFCVDIHNKYFLLGFDKQSCRVVAMIDGRENRFVDKLGWSYNSEPIVAIEVTDQLIQERVEQEKYWLKYKNEDGSLEELTD